MLLKAGGLVEGNTEPGCSPPSGPASSTICVRAGLIPGRRSSATPSSTSAGGAAAARQDGYRGGVKGCNDAGDVMVIRTDTLAASSAP